MGPGQLEQELSQKQYLLVGCVLLAGLPCLSSVREKTDSLAEHGSGRVGRTTMGVPTCSEEKRRRETGLGRIVGGLVRRGQ